MVWTSKTLRFNLLSWRQARNPPTRVGLARVQNAVVQPRRPALPEFDSCRHEPLAAPLRRARRVRSEALADRLCPLLAHRPPGSSAPLLGGPCAAARAEPARRNVGIALLRARILACALDAHLPLELDPVEKQAGPRT